jgi:hypothetical protein
MSQSTKLGGKAIKMHELNIAAQLVNKQIKKKMLVTGKQPVRMGQSRKLGGKASKIHELLPSRARPEKSLAITFSSFTNRLLPSLYK